MAGVQKTRPRARAQNHDAPNHVRRPQPLRPFGNGTPRLHLQIHRPLKPIDVAAALIFHHGELLITQRRPDDHLPNLWEFPGGKVESGETFEACLIREIREELAIEISVGDLVEDLTHSYLEKTVRLR